MSEHPEDMTLDDALAMAVVWLRVFSDPAVSDVHAAVAVRKINAHREELSILADQAAGPPLEGRGPEGAPRVPKPQPKEER